MRIHVRAPATTANLGPGFDVAGAALELWNELEVERGRTARVDETHLGVRAFARFASPDGRSFTFTDRIPRERGLGSSAAVVALGLVAGAIAAGADPDADELLAEGLELEGHADNLAAALAGGVCLTWDGRIARIADDVPAAAIAVVPQTRVNTAEARASLPQTVPHADAVFSAVARRCSAPRSPAATPSSSQRLRRPAARAVPRRARAASRRDPRRPAGRRLGATLSGSGPTVIVWAEKRRAARRGRRARRALSRARSPASAVTTTGAGTA